jgi:osmoprotectant transport system permease protein
MAVQAAQSDVAVTFEASDAVTNDRRSWRRIILQFVGIVVVAAALAIWLATAPLTKTERVTLGPGALFGYIGQHLLLTFVSAVIVLAIGLPLGILLTRKPMRFLTGPILVIANIGQAAPAVGLVVLLAFWLGFGFEAAVVALVLYALLPVLRNTMVGINQVDSRLVEAARGMGMSSMATLFRVELPLAVPIMLSGVRTAMVLLVGTAALATFVDGGGLGLLITTGVNLGLTSVLVTGALIVALLALLIDLLGRIVEQIAQPKGLS